MPSASIAPAKAGAYLDLAAKLQIEMGRCLHSDDEMKDLLARCKRLPVAPAKVRVHFDFPVKLEIELVPAYTGMTK